jgi:uncharacterized protein YggU (UPF0235/DUF167 family)
MSFWRVTTDGVAVAVKVRPRSRRAGVGGVAPGSDGPRLSIGVAEAPEGGEANRAACAAIARAIGVPASTVRVTSGMTRREKTLVVSGDPAAITARLAAL